MRSQLRGAATRCKAAPRLTSRLRISGTCSHTCEGSAVLVRESQSLRFEVLPARLILRYLHCSPETRLASWLCLKEGHKVTKHTLCNPTCGDTPPRCAEGEVVGNTVTLPWYVSEICFHRTCELGAETTSVDRSRTKLPSWIQGVALGIVFFLTGQK